MTPTGRRKSTRTIWLTGRETGPNATSLKPSFDAVRVYEPGTRVGVVYSPSPFDFERTDGPWSDDRITTFALGTTAFEASRTSPRNIPPGICGVAATCAR